MFATKQMQIFFVTGDMSNKCLVIDVPIDKFFEMVKCPTERN